MKSLENLYLEHEGMITNNLPDIKHVDLWKEQVSFLADELPFKSPAIFLSYRILDTIDAAGNGQILTLGIDIYYYYETLSNTHRSSKNQNKALGFLDMISKIHALFHGTDGENYSEMRRAGMSPVETGTSNLLYVQKFQCTADDDSAMTIFEETSVNEIDITKSIDVEPDEEEDYIEVR
jgi:hypothetical protein